MTAILGINAFHGDSSAALIVNGELVAAVEEERFNRVKHWAGFPSESIKWCLEQGNITPDDLDHVASSSNPRANTLKKLGFLVKNRPSFDVVVSRLKRRRKSLSFPEQFAQAVGCQRSKIRAKFHQRFSIFLYSVFS